eukprot:TRINITY_DN6123_c0_g1_i1.p4 TRINITY_DN6123_c0_g1~~TRINITY_DN6123_c0_g1_i1.p4  ORF type:complete len:191 (-),score=35.91 TRINITY_DN6123_c0_g1_i1:52-624(-)
MLALAAARAVGAARPSARVSPRTVARTHLRWLDTLAAAQAEPAAPAAPPTLTAKVVNASRNTVYFFWVVGALGVTVGAAAMLVKRIFAGAGPSHLVDSALERIRAHETLSALLGDQLAVVRREHVPREEFEHDGADYIRIRFRVAGTRHEAAVLCEARNTGGKWVWTYLNVAVPEVKRHFSLVAEAPRRR